MVVQGVTNPTLIIVTLLCGWVLGEWALRLLLKRTILEFLGPSLLNVAVK